MPQNCTECDYNSVCKSYYGGSQCHFANEICDSHAQTGDSVLKCKVCGSRFSRKNANIEAELAWRRGEGHGDCMCPNCGASDGMIEEVW